MLIARTDIRNPTAMNPTRTQSQPIQRRTSKLSSASLLTMLPDAQHHTAH